MLTDDEARRAGFRNARDMQDYADAMRDEDEIARWIEAGAPPPLLMWWQIDGVTMPETVPLTVNEAATRMNMSAKSVRRRLPALEAMEPRGAYRTDPDNPRAPWRIIPAALDRLHEQTVEPKPAPPPRGNRKPQAAVKRSATRWEV